MDSISNAKGLLGLFGIIIFIFLVLLVGSFLVWIENKKISKIMYLTTAIITAITYYSAVCNIFAWCSWQENKSIYVWGVILAGIGGAILAGSLI